MSRTNDTILDKERRRQQAQDDIHEELTEHSRKEEEEDVAPINERLDPTTMPDLYPDFDADTVETDDSWY
ncbi:hypothetical protein GGF41_009000, partial [Coemansia sp. RSA 2531]